MIEQIDTYSGGARNLSSLLSSLEGGLDVAEVRDDGFLSKWHDLWDPLEVHCSSNLDPDNYLDEAWVKVMLGKLKMFILLHIEN